MGLSGFHKRKGSVSKQFVDCSFIFGGSWNWTCSIEIYSVVIAKKDECLISAGAELIIIILINIGSWSYPVE